MSIRRYFSPLLIFTAVLVLAACGPTGNVSSGNVDPAIQPDSAPAAETNGPFRAEATSAISVDLSWDPVADATGYRIENSFADSEWFMLAEVDAGQTTYEDFLTPSNMELNYRLTPLLGDQDGKALDLVVTTPEQVPNPFTVVAILEEPVSIGIDLPGFDASTFDPSTFDPSTLDLSGVDTENLDLSSLQPEPVSALAEIGPEGGMLSVTGANGVIYTLDVPPGALAFTTFLVMTPVQTIEGYPFSGGYFGAVQIRPEGMYFDAPVTLTFQIPNTEEMSEADLINVGFAFERGGEEFHLVPFEEGANETSAVGFGKLTSPTESPYRDTYTMASIRSQRTGSTGAGRARSSEKRSFTKTNSPTKDTDRAEQEVAASQSSSDSNSDIQDLTMRNRWAIHLHDKLAGASNIMSFADIYHSDFRQFYNSPAYGKLHQDYRDYIWEAAITTARNFMWPKNCPSPEAAAVQELVRRIRTPASAFDAEFSRRWKERDPGDERLHALISVDGCEVKLVIESTVTWSEDICKWWLTVNAEIELFWHYINKNAYLTGADYLKYENPENIKVGQGFDPNDHTCLEFRVNNLSPALIYINHLQPIFKKDVLTDWSLVNSRTAGWAANGHAKNMCQKYRDDVDPDKQVYESCGPFPDGVEKELWGGSVNLINYQKKLALGAKNWKIDRNLASPLKAEWPKTPQTIKASLEGWQGTYTIKFTLTNR